MAVVVPVKTGYQDYQIVNWDHSSNVEPGSVASYSGT
jgi:hypothetical protein